MKKTRQPTFSELSTLLKGLGFRLHRNEKAWVFKHPKEGLIIFRLYGDNEAVDQGDLWSTRLFLDYRGILPEKDFDAFVEGPAARA